MSSNGFAEDAVQVAWKGVWFAALASAEAASMIVMAEGLPTTAITHFITSTFYRRTVLSGEPKHKSSGTDAEG